MGSQDLHLVDTFLDERSEVSFRNLYRALTPRLYPMALRLSGGDIGICDEMMQDMWVRAIRKLETFEKRSSIMTWMIGILINVNRERYRDDIRNESWPEAEADIPVLTLKRELLAMDIERAIASLPAGYRQVLVLHDIEGYKHKDIAEMLNINEGTSKSQLFQARKAMRKFLIENSE